MQAMVAASIYWPQGGKLRACYPIQRVDITLAQLLGSSLDQVV